MLHGNNMIKATSSCASPTSAIHNLNRKTRLWHPFPPPGIEVVILDPTRHTTEGGREHSQMKSTSPVFHWNQVMLSAIHCPPPVSYCRRAVCLLYVCLWWGHKCSSCLLCYFGPETCRPGQRRPTDALSWRCLLWRLQKSSWSNSCTAPAVLQQPWLGVWIKPTRTKRRICGAVVCMSCATDTRPPPSVVHTPCLGAGVSLWV